MRIISTLFYFLCTLLLLGDSIKASDSSLRYLGVDSRLLAVIFLFVNIVFALKYLFLLPKAVLTLNRYIFYFSGLASVFLILINYFAGRELIFRTLFIQLENFALIPIFCGGLVYVHQAKKLNKKLLHQRIIYLLPPIIIFAFLFVDVYLPDLFSWVVREDGILENIQFVLYILAAIFSFKVCLKQRKNKVVALFFFSLFLLLSFIAFEEISWGQRIFGFQTPETVAHNNFQKEFTVHNQSSFQRYVHLFYIALGLAGSLSRIVFRKYAPKKFSKLIIITPPTILFFYFFSVALYYFLNQYLTFYYQMITTSRMGLGKWQEVSEIFLSTGFLLFVYFVWNETRAKQPSKRK